MVVYVCLCVFMCIGVIMIIVNVVINFLFLYVLGCLQVCKDVWIKDQVPLTESGEMVG